MEVSQLLCEPTTSDFGVNAKISSSTLSTPGSFEFIPAQYRVCYQLSLCVYIPDSRVLSSLSEASPMAAG